jgi:hypothetical protein
MVGNVVDTQVVNRMPECLLISSPKAQNGIRKSSKVKIQTAEFFMVHLKVVDQ